MRFFLLFHSFSIAHSQMLSFLHRTIVNKIKINKSGIEVLSDEWEYPSLLSLVVWHTHMYVRALQPSRLPLLHTRATGGGGGSGGGGGGGVQQSRYARGDGRGRSERFERRLRRLLRQDECERPLSSSSYLLQTLQIQALVK